MYDECTLQRLDRGLHKRSLRYAGEVPEAGRSKYDTLTTKTSVLCFPGLYAVNREPNRLVLSHSWGLNS